jgi:hypothetical protein
MGLFWAVVTCEFLDGWFEGLQCPFALRSSICSSESERASEVDGAALPAHVGSGPHPGCSAVCGIQMDAGLGGCLPFSIFVFTEFWTEYTPFSRLVILGDGVYPNSYYVVCIF